MNVARFSKEIYAKYKQFDYDGVINNYEWITNTLTSLFEGVQAPEVELSFHMGDISCGCKSIDEFKEHAFGQAIDIFVYEITYYQEVDNKRRIIAWIFLSASDKKQVSISCDDKQTLITICTALEKSLSSEIEMQPVILQQTVNHIDQSTNFSFGDNNTIQNSNIGEGNQLHNEEHSGKDSFWKPIWQTIVANWIWFLLGLGVAALLAYFGFNTDWTSLF